MSDLNDEVTVLKEQLDECFTNYREDVSLWINEVEFLRTKIKLYEDALKVMGVDPNSLDETLNSMV